MLEVRYRVFCIESGYSFLKLCHVLFRGVHFSIFVCVFGHSLDRRIQIQLANYFSTYKRKLRITLGIFAVVSFQVIQKILRRIKPAIAVSTDFLGEDHRSVPLNKLCRFQVFRSTLATVHAHAIRASALKAIPRRFATLTWLATSLDNIRMCDEIANTAREYATRLACLWANKFVCVHSSTLEFTEANSKPLGKQPNRFLGKRHGHATNAIVKI